MGENLEFISNQSKNETTNILENLNSNKQLKLIFFVKEGLDSFLDDIIEGLLKEYEIKKIVITEYKQIDEGMKWADICWFEWCDELISYGSKLELAKEKKIICRLHRYEAFTNYIENVEWQNVNKLIFVSEHIRDVVINKISLQEEQCEVVHNGINLDKFKFVKRNKGFNLAWIGYINLRKNPMLVMQYLNELVKIDKRYKLFIAGSFQDETLYSYINYIIRKLGLENNIEFHGFISNSQISKWLEDKNYIVTGSIAEGHPVGIMEAMASGLKPIIHCFPGIEKLYPDEYIYYNLDDFKKIVNEDNYDSNEYRKFIEDNYSLEKQINLIKNLIKDIKGKDSIVSIVREFLNNERQNEVNLEDCTVLITSFNRAKVLIDDLVRGFKFGLQDKVIIDDCSTEETKEMNIITKSKEKFNIKDIIIHENNKGVSASRYTGFKNVKTSSTIVLDDDDMILCIDKKGMEEDCNRLKQDAVIVIPRYIVNLYEDGELKIGYDRNLYNELYAKNVLQDISTISEIRALCAGCISKTSELLQFNPNEAFIISEDLLMLIRLFANNLDKKVVVTENYVHVRRMNSFTLSKTINEKKLALGLITQCVGCYYCIKNSIFKIEDAFCYMRKRGVLLQSIYNYSEKFVEIIISYLNDEMQEEIFVKYLNKLEIKVEKSIDEICLEINLMKILCTLEPKSLIGSDIKKCISEFLERGLLLESKIIIEKYREKIEYDDELAIMESFINIENKDYDEAFNNIRKGLKYNVLSGKLYFNMGRVYEIKKDFNRAYLCYEQAMSYADNTYDKDIILKGMESLKEKSKITINNYSVVILTYNNLNYTKKCIESIKEFNTINNYEIIVVDNNSTDGTPQWLKEQKDIKYILNSENKGFPAGCNQGIEIAKSNNDIFLLNNDTVIMSNSIFNLRMGLYSSENVGVTGAISNYASYYQGLGQKYDTLEEYMRFAMKNNITNEALYENRLKVLGFAMLIKRSVLDKVGILDEIFTPGNYEDDDLCFRIILAGYKILLCKDCYIHHFGSVTFKTDTNKYENILEINSKKFEDKWGFNSKYSTFIRYEIINLIENDSNKNINVLEVGCACGATLLAIKNKYPNSNIYGIELNENAVKIAETFADVRAENVENINLSYEEDYFDYIIFADVLEHLYNPHKALRNMTKYLKNDGCILASIPNVMHYSVIKALINGNWTYEDAGILDKTHIRFFTLNEINNMFVKSGYKEIVCSANILQSTEEDKEFIDRLSQLSNDSVKNQFDFYQYFIKATKRIDNESINIGTDLEENFYESEIVSTLNNKMNFVTIFPETENSHLTKDVGMIPYIMYKHFGYNSKIVCYKKGEYSYLKKEVNGLKIDFIENTGDTLKDGLKYINNNAKDIDILHVFHLSERSLSWIYEYKSKNPYGKVYLKLDASNSITNYILNDSIIKILKMCTLISVETKYLYNYLNENWKLDVKYIPNGFYDYGKRKYIEFSEKENIICTVGRIGIYQKANEILLEAFKVAAPKLSNWKLKIIGPISEEFKPYILKYFNENPQLKDRVTFTGEIVDKELLENEYRKAKIFCLTSRWEGFPMVFPEAARNGCYIISSNIIPAWDITDNRKYGEIFDINNIEQLSHLLISNANDDKKLKENCLEIQKFVYDNFEWLDICKKINDYC